MGRINLFGRVVLLGSGLIVGCTIVGVYWAERLDIQSSKATIQAIHQRTTDVVTPFLLEQKPLPPSYTAAINRSEVYLKNVEFYHASTLERLNQLIVPVEWSRKIHYPTLLKLKLPVSKNGNILGLIEYQWVVPSWAGRLLDFAPLILAGLLGWVVLAWWLSKRISQQYIEPLQEMDSVLSGESSSGEVELPDSARLLERIREVLFRVQTAESSAHTAHSLSQRALASIGEALLCVDGEGRIIDMNPAAEKLTGWPRDLSIDKPVEVVLDLLDSDGDHGERHPVRKVLEEALSKQVEAVCQLISRDGTRYVIRLTAAPLSELEEPTTGVVIMCHEVSELYETRIKLQRSARLLGQIADATPVMIWSMDANRRFNFANQATRDFFGSGACAVWRDYVSHADPDDQGTLIQSLDQLSPQQERQVNLECRLTDSRGQKVWVYTHVNALWNSAGKLLAYVGSSIDISDRKQAETEIERLAFYDSLTGLPNRRLLLDRLGQAIIAAQRDRVYGAVYFLDLDNFKTLNDSMGHAVGDQLLIQVADRIRTTLRAEDTVARFGGDEFVILSGQLEYLEHEAARNARLLGEKIRSILARPYRLDDYEYHSTPSIGITLFSQTSTDVEEVLMQADTAMYRAKSDGRNNARFYEPQMQESIINQIEMEKALREALRDKQLTLYYQPQVDAQGDLTGVEALLRWPQADGSMLSPLSFLSVAEDTGLIIQIGLWVLETVCQQLHEWEQHQVLPEGFTLALNISRRQFVQQDFVARFEEIIMRSRIDPAHLQIEITEKVVKDSMSVAIEKMMDLKKRLRVRISLDDFGTGFSSLTYLRQFPLDQLKIDKSFIRDLNSDPDDAQLTEAILDLGLKMGVKVVAEGVESQQQFDFLQARGCGYFQGFWFGKPVPADQISFSRYYH